METTLLIMAAGIAHHNLSGIPVPNKVSETSAEKAASKKAYICHVIFFIVLDLRLTKVGARRCSFFYAPTSSLFLFRLTTNINFALIRSQLYNHTIRSIFRRTAIETIYLFQR